AGPALRVRSPPRMRVPVDVRVELVEAVAEQPWRPTRDERVLARPARPVGRIVRVEIDEPPVAVRRRAVQRGAEPAHAPAPVRVPPEEMLEAAAVDPVGVSLEHRQLPR